VRTLLTKRMALVAIGCIVPPVMAWFFMTLPRFHPPPIEAFLYPSFFLVLQLMVPLAAVIAGSAVISEELDDRTITYLLTRPVPRASILLGRWLATLTILLVFVGASVTALGLTVERLSVGYVTSNPETFDAEQAEAERARSGDAPTTESTPDDRATDRPTDHTDDHTPPRDDHNRQRRRREPPPPAVVAAMTDGQLPSGLLEAVLTAALLGTAVYSALFAVLGTFVKHPMMVGLGYAFAIEGFLANLPGASQSWTIQFYLRSYLLSHHRELWHGIEDANLAKFDTADEAVTKLAIFLAVTLVVGCITIRRRQYVLSA
jgi:hypothetical protein